MTTINESNQLNIHRLFLTGGSGYIGRNIIRHFINHGIEIVALVRSQNAEATVTALGAKAVFGNLQDENLSELMKDCDALIHAAADVNHGYTTEKQFEVNAAGTRNVFAAAANSSINKALYISTESVLLDGQPLIKADETHPYPQKPAGNYSHSKMLAEQTALSFSSKSFSVVVIRPRFVWGRDDSTSLPQLLTAAKSGNFAWIDGGKYLTSTTHIANLCEGVTLTLKHGRNGEIYFITDETPVEFKSFVSKLLETQGVTVEDKKIPRKLLYGMARVGDFLSFVTKGKLQLPVTLQSYATSAVEVTINIDKAKQELGYTASFTHQQGLEELSRFAQTSV